MKMPFFRVFIDNDEKREITDLIESFRYEDSIKEDNLLELRMYSKFVENFEEDKDLITGAILIFQFGYLGQETSITQTIRITDLNYRYADKITLTIKALDKGTKMKKTTSNKVWKNVNTKDIVEEIAGRYGMDYKVEGSLTTWPSVPQSNFSDFEFLQQLALREKDGNYIVYVYGNELRFIRRGLNRKSIMTMIYGRGSGNVLSFTPKHKESSSKSASVGTMITGFDPKTKQVVSSKSDNSNEKNSITLGDFKSVYDEQGDKLGIEKDGIITNAADKVFDNVTKIQNRLIGNTSNQTELDNIANNLKKESDLKNMRADLTTMGNPLIESNDIITMAGVLDRHKGNYLIEKVVHSITDSGYVTTSSLLKNGKYVPTKSNADKANTKAGNEQDDKKEVVNVYDANGNKLTDTTDNYDEPR